MGFSSLVKAEFAPNELIIKLATEPVRSLDQSIQSSGIAALDSAVSLGRAEITSPFVGLLSQFPQVSTILHIRWSDEINLDSLERVLSADPRVRWVSRNNIYRPNSLDELPNDPMRTEQYWLNLIHAPEAWELTHGDSSIVIGVIDTGIDYLHPDLAANIWHNHAEIDSNGIDDDQNGFIDDRNGWDFVDAPAFPSSGDYLTRDNDPMDELGHGTYVAGVAAAATNNATCFSSIGFDCRIMCLRAGNAEGLLEEDDIAAAILYAAANGASVLNMSFGDVVVSPLLREAILIAHDARVIQVSSAGNANSQSIHYPSGFAEVISVGATDQLDRRANFSNYGPTVDLFAPGFEIISTILGGECGTWDFPHGTSYASPMVAATAALILSINPQLDQQSVTDILRSSADDLRGAGWDPETAHGRLNVRRAVELAEFGSDVVAQIDFPPTDLGLTDNIEVTGDAWGAAFNHYELSFGLGENPRSWTEIASGSLRVFAGTLGSLELPARDTVLVIRLETIGNSGQTALDHRHVYVQRAAPAIDSLRIRRMLNADSYGDLVEVWTPQVTTATFLLSRDGQSNPIRHDFGYVSDSHAGLLSQIEHAGRWTVTVELTNQAELRTQSAPFNYEITEPAFNSNLWSRTITNAPRGYFGAFSTDYNFNGIPEFWLWPIGPERGTNDPLSPYEWDGTNFIHTGNEYGGHIPQAVGDADQDGLIEMMARNGEVTRIWEPREQNQFPDSVIFEALDNTVGAGFFELDSVDPGEEIVFRKNVNRDSTGNSRYVCFHVSSNYQLAPFDTLPNLTAGNNLLGIPKLVVGDLDQDGLRDAIFGDYDGDIIFCEQESGKFRQKWSVRLPQDDATAWFDSGQLDEDPELEFIAGCRVSGSGGTESQRRARHWQYFIFDNTGNDQFTVADSVFVLGIDNVSSYPASVACASVDDDLPHEILISAYPDLYIVKYNPVSGRYQPAWYYNSSASNTFLIVDWDHNGINEFFFSDGEHIARVEATGSSSQRPLPPASLSHEPTSATSLQLFWSPVFGTDDYRIYRSRRFPDFDLVGASLDTFFQLTDVESDTPFVYAITTIDLERPITESAYSPFITAIANSAPASFDTAEFIPPHFIAIRFSEAMGPSAFQQWNYQLDGSTYPEVVLSGEGDRVIFLTFNGTLTNGDHNITMTDLRDAQYAQLPASEQIVYLRIQQVVVDLPRVIANQNIGGPAVTEIEITYSDPMSESVLNAANYRIEDPHRVISITAQSSDRAVVRVHLDPRYPVGALGTTARMLVRNVFDEQGREIDTASANILIGNPFVSLDAAYVYPNPYAGRGADGHEQVMFAGLPELAHIRVFDLRGVLVREFEHHNSLGGTPWDMKNANGEKIAAGVYIYTIESSGQTVRGKLAILR